jgi:hypothetical protein
VNTLPAIPCASVGENDKGRQFCRAAVAASTNDFFALASPSTLMAVGLGGPISVPSRLKLKLSVTLAFPASAGGVQHAWIAARTSFMVLSVAAFDEWMAPADSAPAIARSPAVRFIAKASSSPSIDRPHEATGIDGRGGSGNGNMLREAFRKMFRQDFVEEITDPLSSSVHQALQKQKGRRRADLSFHLGASTSVVAG